MPVILRRALALLAVLIAALCAQPASACTTANSTIALPGVSSYTVATTAQSGSGSAGLSCNVTLALLTDHYIRLRTESISSVLTGPGGLTIPFTASRTSGGAPLVANTTLDLSSTAILTLFAGQNSTIPLFIRTSPTANLRAGTYTGTINLRWFYSVCSVGVAACLSYSNSPGLVRPLLGAPTNWGQGVPVTVTVELVVQNDCVITAPSLAFGTAPLVGAFNAVTRTIQIRCSAGAAYTVGLNNGANASGTVRRMRSGTNYLNYEIYKTTASTERWGAVGTARRSSSTADTNAGVYNSSTNQTYTYRAVILSGQITPPPGNYLDTIQLDVIF
ncbi:fimbrial major subunit CsuA/B family protein [Altererythrobacter xixiisoli]|uniref:Fimbrial major subunit CsuA/B family protein n=1 Tax=Croceibacterium xixiisoli TaxID=1476466 RepID=A0A6I4TQY0_9SPHN|nr:spore coat U domain-containing protein [Croceibacterium xixiisoli]MXO97520.1 fimbrial major subunit CsuA/B family protein [Croceibacterium xixiisoli]